MVPAQSIRYGVGSHATAAIMTAVFDH